MGMRLRYADLVCGHYEFVELPRIWAEVFGEISVDPVTVANALETATEKSEEPFSAKFSVLAWFAFALSAHARLAAAILLPLNLTSGGSMRGFRIGMPAALASRAASPIVLVAVDGGAWGGRQDGHVGAYGCGPADSNLAVLVMPNQGATSAIDRSMPVWTVKVSELGSATADFPPPHTQTVATASFAGDFIPV